MKPAHTHFRDQVSALVGWFSNWNECEQTIALYTLLKRISTTQARFLSLILEHTFRDDPVEIQLLQRQANDKEFLSNLCHETKAVAVQQLLAHLPLLVPGNDEARFEYLQLLPKILTHTVQHSVHQDECMQLLSLALVHPAFPPEERNSLLCWLSHLEKTLGIKERQNSGPARLQTTESSDMPGSCDNLVRHNYTRGRVNGWRNQPLVHHDSGLGSFETQPSYGNYNSDVPMWLKSLRLHKYGSLFSQLSYEEMLNLSDEYLESKGVTKGARNKILLSTRKLQERSDTLQKLEKEVLQNGKLQAVLKELQQIVNTPIKPFTPSPGVATSGSVSSSKLAEQSTPNPPPHPDDLPGWITRVMGKACTQILVSRADEEHCTLYLTLLDKTLASEAFTPTQKRRLQSWKQQCQRLVRQQQFARRPSSQEKSRGWYY
ncbi:predicted protein, partial [Nematostella vectensis]